MQFNEIIFTSRAVRRYMQVERLSDNEVYELFFNCFCSYIDMMMERLKTGRELNRMISAYTGIAEFRSATPEKLFKTLFTSPHMHAWFAYRFVFEADKQLLSGHTDKDELWLSLAFSSAIPVAEKMKQILTGETINYIETCTTTTTVPDGNLTKSLSN
jgi:hypothetical protein